MKKAPLFVVTALLAGFAGAGGPRQESRPLTTVDVAAVRATPITASQVVPWTLARDLAREDVDVFVDGEPCAIESFAADTRPVSIVVLLDVSASTEVGADSLLEPLLKGMIPALKPGDRVSFGRFGGTAIRLGPRFGSGAAQLAKTAREVLTRPRREEALAAAPVQAVLPAGIVPVKPDPVIVAQGWNGAYGLGASPAWDAVHDAVAALESESGRRAIIMLTDGRSSGNVHSLDEAIQRALVAGVEVHTVGESDEEMIPQAGPVRARVRSSAFLESLAATTGGAYAPIFGPEPARPARLDEPALQKWMARILGRLVDDLHGSYALGFVAPVGDNALHDVEVRVRRPGLKVRAPTRCLAR